MSYTNTDTISFRFMHLFSCWMLSLQWPHIQEALILFVNYSIILYFSEGEPEAHLHASPNPMRFDARELVWRGGRQVRRGKGCVQKAMLDQAGFLSSWHCYCCSVLPATSLRQYGATSPWSRQLEGEGRLIFQIFCHWPKHSALLLNCQSLFGCPLRSSRIKEGFAM